MSLAMGLGVASAGMGLANQIWGTKDVEKSKTTRWIDNDNPLQGNIEGLRGASRDSYTKHWIEQEKTGFGKFADIATPALGIAGSVAGSGLFSSKPNNVGGILDEVGKTGGIGELLNNTIGKTSLLSSNPLTGNKFSLSLDKMAPIVSNTDVDILSIYEDLINQSK